MLSLGTSFWIYARVKVASSVVDALWYAVPYARSLRAATAAKEIEREKSGVSGSDSEGKIPRGDIASGKRISAKRILAVSLPCVFRPREESRIHTAIISFH